MYPVTWSNEGFIGIRTLHQYAYPNTTSETTHCGLRVPNVVSCFAIKNEDIDCEVCVAKVTAGMKEGLIA